MCIASSNLFAVFSAICTVYPFLAVLLCNLFGKLIFAVYFANIFFVCPKKDFLSTFDNKFSSHLLMQAQTKVSDY